MASPTAANQPTRQRGLLLRHHDFRWFWAGQSVSVVGTQVTAVALPLVAALSLGASAGGVSVIATAAFLPNVLLPLFAGHWLETRRRRRIMIAADVLRAVLLALVPLAAVLDRLSLTLLAVVAFGVGAASVMFDVGSFAYLPSLVSDEDLPAANQAMQGSSTAAQVAGPGVAGLLVQAAGPSAAIAIDSASYLASVLGLTAARKPEPAPELDDELPAGILQGIRQILVNPILRALTTHAAIYNLAAQILTVNLVVWLVKERGLSAGGYGLALSAAGVGAFFGTMLALRLARRLGYGRAFAASLTLSTGVPLLLATFPFSGFALGAAVAAVQLVSGAGLGSANVLSVTLRQVVAPRGSLARTNGGYRLLIYGVIPFGSALGGVIGELFSSRVGVAVGTVGLAISAIPMVRRRVRTLRDPQDARRLVAGEPVRAAALTDS
ncbi:MAG: MFS transporter [Actinobacteria bacterium]|nr:MFS transporter [Actinomycetota bacterium]